ncbi:hypothetical protein Hypma_004326 [Hypsizygus marmoreus]|uniref:Uncharacterized protein n=1 Tax=Hypsizygus marmoreus TaxID=39966 RepID=A0A369K6C6_HYPMA|nr:hypothetical protein Hypma_004326 [Hypsizygus marmoreus]
MASDTSPGPYYPICEWRRYWCEETQLVEAGIEPRTSPFDLSSLCGTYHWVWYGNSEAGDPLIEPETEDSDNDGEGHDEWGSITIQRKAKTKPATPGNFKGSFEMCMLSGKIDGLLKHKDEKTKRTIPNSWMIKRTEWIEGQDMPEEGQRLYVSEKLDDNGHPFLGFFCTDGGGCHGSPDTNMIAKRQKEGYEPGKGMPWVGLTKKEKRRLGFELTDGEIRRRAKQGYAEEEEDDESEDESGEASEESLSEDEDDGTRASRKRGPHTCLADPLEERPATRVRLAN